MGSYESAKLPPAARRGGAVGSRTDLLDRSPRTRLPRSAAPRPATRGRNGSGDTLLDGLSGGGLKLSAPVGPGARNRPDDVFRLETVLAGADLLGREPGRVFDEGTERAVRTAQGRLNRDHAAHVGRRPLKLDGLVNPDGPTQAATRRLATAILAGTGERGRRPLPGVKTTEQRFTERRRAVLDRLSAGAYAANRRSVDHLMTTTDDGLFPKLLADDFRAGDADLLVQLAVRDPARAGSLRRRAVAAMSADERDLLDGLVADLTALRARDDGVKPKPPDDHHPDPEESGEGSNQQHRDGGNGGKREKEQRRSEACERLNVEFRRTEARYLAEQERLEKISEALNRKLDDARQKQDTFLEAATRTGMDAFLILNELRKGRLPRGIVLPSDALAAKRAYDVAAGEARSLRQEIDQAQSDFDRAGKKMLEVGERMKKNGCP